MPGVTAYTASKAAVLPTLKGRISSVTVRAALKQRCAEARLPPISSEDPRRTGPTRLFKSGADLYAVADLVGP